MFLRTKSVRRFLAAIALVPLLALVPAAPATAAATDANAYCYRPWLSSDVEFGVTGTFNAFGGTGPNKIMATLFHKSGAVMDTVYHESGSALMKVTDWYGPVTGGSNYYVDAWAWRDGTEWKHDRCWIT